MRDHLSVAANSGHGPSQSILDGGPECPSGFDYLKSWAYQLHGRSGAGVSGLAPLSPTTIRHWRKELGLPPLDPLEFTALITLDAAMLAPGDMEGSE